MNSIDSECLKAFSGNLKLLLIERHLPQRKVCEATGITTSAMSALVMGERNPSLDTVYRIAKFFDVSIDELVGLNGKKTEIGRKMKNEIEFSKKVRELVKEFYENNE